MRSARWYIGAGLAILFGVTLVVYTGVKARPFLRGPVVTIAAPLPGFVFERGAIAVIGTAESVAYLTLNGRQIFVDERGIFRETLLLHPGYTVVAVVGRDRFGREARAVVGIVRK